MTQVSLRWAHTIDLKEVFHPGKLLDDLEQAGVNICESFDERMLPAAQQSLVEYRQERRMFHIYELSCEKLLGWQIRNLFPSKHHLQLEDMLQAFIYIASGKTGIPLVIDAAFRSFVHTNQVFFADLWYSEGSDGAAVQADLSAEGLGDDPTWYGLCYVIVRAYEYEPPIGMRELTELEYDAHGSGGPSSGHVRPRWKPMNQ